MKPSPIKTKVMWYIHSRSLRNPAKKVSRNVLIAPALKPDGTIPKKIGAYFPAYTVRLTSQKGLIGFVYRTRTRKPFVSLTLLGKETHRTLMSAVAAMVLKYLKTPNGGFISYRMERGKRVQLSIGLPEATCKKYLPGYKSARLRIPKIPAGYRISW